MLEDFYFKIRDAMPESFEFYEKGQVKKQTLGTTTKLDIDGKLLFSINLFGVSDSMNALLIFIVDDLLDEAWAEEIGNVIGSKLANNLGEAMLAPPKKVKKENLDRLLAIGVQTVYQKYTFLYKGMLLPIETLVFPSKQSEARSDA